MDPKWLHKPVRKRATNRSLLSVLMIIMLVVLPCFYLFVATVSRDFFWFW